MEFLKTNNKTIYSGILIVLAICLLLGYVPSMSAFSSWVTPPVALFLGLAFALLCGQAYPKFNKKVSKKLLQYSVVGLGFGMNLHASLASGKEGMMFTIISVIGTMIIGMFIGRKILNVNRDTSYLISSGTAICGGSAIAAVGPVIKAKDSEMASKGVSIEEIKAIKHAKADPVVAAEKGQILWEVMVEGESLAPAIGKHYAADELFHTIITPWRELQPVAAGLGGRVIEICAKQGDHVNRGEIIAYLQRDELFN